MDGTNGNVKMLEVLERIANSVEQLNERVDALGDRVDRGFASVNGRLDNVIAFMGRGHGDHEQRIQALEERVFKKTS